MRSWKRAGSAALTAWRSIKALGSGQGWSTRQRPGSTAASAGEGVASRGRLGLRLSCSVPARLCSSRRRELSRSCSSSRAMAKPAPYRIAPITSSERPARRSRARHSSAGAGERLALMARQGAGPGSDSRGSAPFRSGKAGRGPPVFAAAAAPGPPPHCSPVPAADSRAGGAAGNRE